MLAGALESANRRIGEHRGQHSGLVTLGSVRLWGAMGGRDQVVVEIESHGQGSRVVAPKEALILLLEDSPRGAELIERAPRRAGFSSPEDGSTR